MRSISSDLAVHLAGGVTTLCTCWRLRRRDGTVMGFTDHDRNINFDSSLFISAGGLSASSLESSLGFAVAGAEVTGILNSAQINEQDLSAGLYDEARIEIWKVNWSDPAKRVLLDVADIGEVRRADNAFTAVLRSLSHILDQERGQYFQASCSADLGDQRCGIDIQAGAYTRTGQIIGGDGRLELIIDVTGFDTGYFDNGVLAILSGTFCSHCFSGIHAMTATNFEKCLALTLQYEGGYVDHPADPGGATNLGITRRTLAAFRGRVVTKTEVRQLSRAEAAQIYRRKYWNAVRGDELPAGVDAAVFDHAVNSGPGAAVRMLQSSLGLKADGAFGLTTSAALFVARPPALIGELIRRRRGFVARLKTFAIFGRGWTRRLQAIEKSSLAMAAHANAATA